MKTTNLSSIIPASKARVKFFDIIKKIQQPDSRFILTVDGEPKAVMISADEWESIMATLDIATDFKMTKAIKQGKKEIEEGKYYALDEVLDEMGLEVVKDKGEKYKVKKTKNKNKKK